LSFPFIDILYRLKFRNPKHKSEDMFGKKTIFSDLHGHKTGTPTGAGILMIILIIFFATIAAVFFVPVAPDKLLILLAAATAFGLIGFLDDISKFFDLRQNGILGLRIRHKFLLQLLSAFVLSYLLNTSLGLSSVGLPGLFSIELGSLYMVYATLFITYFLNAFNISDGLDGLSGGMLLIILVALWVVLGPVVGAETLVVSIMVGVTIAFLYFNINHARFFMGDTGSLGLGAILAVLALMTQTDLLLVIAGSVIMFEGLSSLMQWYSIKYMNKRIFKIAPVHHHFEAIGWEETKVTMRFWLATIITSLVAIYVFLAGNG